MHLKIKRNIPVLLLLVALLSFLSLAMGSQPISAYSLSMSQATPSQVETIQITTDANLDELDTGEAGSSANLEQSIPLQ